MGITKRMIRSLIVNWKKTCLLTLAYLITMIAVAASLSIRQAVVNTDENLRRQLPAIATVHVDEEEILEARDSSSEWIPLEKLSGEQIRQIGHLPQVKAFDYTIWGQHFFHETLIRPFNPQVLLDSNPDFAPPRDHQSLRTQGFDLEQFALRGTHTPHLVDIQAGLIQLVAGRTFQEDEMANAVGVAIVSMDFMDANALQLGDRISFEHRIYNEADPGVLDLNDWLDPANLLASYQVELEIVGIFRYELSEEPIEWQDFTRFTAITNRIYVPNTLIESFIPRYLDAFITIVPDLLDHLDELIHYENILFLLEDPMDLEAFRFEATELLPPFWRVSDLSNAYGDISHAMANFSWLADTMLISSVVAAIIITSLLTILALKERKQEIGIYLALGETRRALIVQFFVEFLSLAVISAALALGAGSLLAQQISTRHIQQSLAAQAEEEHFLRIEGGTPESLGFSFELTHEEMLAGFDTSLGIPAIINFYLIAMGSIALSTIAPITYVSRLKPRDVLMN